MLRDWILHVIVSSISEIEVCATILGHSDGKVSNRLRVRDVVFNN
jgi:hypothetical protein